MPGIGGIEFLKRLQGLNQSVPVIMISGLNSIDTAVEEHAAAVSQFQKTHLVHDGAREGPFDMPEELALDHSFWEPCAIHQLIGLRALRAQIVNGAGEQLLASAGFSRNQYRRADGSDFLHHAQQGLKRRTDTDQGLEALWLNSHAPE